MYKNFYPGEIHRVPPAFVISVSLIPFQFVCIYRFTYDFSLFLFVFRYMVFYLFAVDSSLR